MDSIFGNPCRVNYSLRMNELHLEAPVQNSYVDTKILL